MQMHKKLQAKNADKWQELTTQNHWEF